MSRIARRKFLRTSLGASAGFLAASHPLMAAAALPGKVNVARRADDEGSLRSKAAAKGILYGSEALYGELHDPGYSALFISQCGILFPGLEAKWAGTEPVQGDFTFDQLDWMMSFAQSNAMAVHLHNLVWGVYEPSWVGDAVKAGNAEAVLTDHIETVVGRYRGQVDSWDVLNEPSDPRWSHGPEGLTYTMWRTALGPLYPAFAFSRTHNSDPGAKLFVNDDGLEYDTPLAETKRQTYLSLIDSWLASGVPINGIGLESHIQPDQPFDEQKYRNFLAELAARKLIIYLTEMDVIDKTFPADIAQRDALVAQACARRLNVALDEKAVKCVMTFGLSSRYSWLSQDGDTKRSDGLPSRGLPFDENLQPTAMFGAIAQAFDAAPAR